MEEQPDFDEVAVEETGPEQDVGRPALAFGPGGLILPARILDVDARPVEWLWPGSIPIGKVTVIAGDPGRGKSLISLDLASRVSTGADWPTGTANSHGPSRVILISAEDDVPDTIRPRLDANGADNSRIHFLASLDHAEGPRPIMLPDDIPRLGGIVAALGSVRLIVFDPVMAFLGPGHSSNQGIRAVVAETQALATRARCAVVFITHLTKAAASSPLYRAMGSLGLVAAARAVHLCWPDEESPGRCLFLPLKSNLSQSLKAYAYTVTTDGAAGSSLAPFVEWEPDPVPLSLLSTSTANPIPRVEDARCAAWLRELLEEGPLPVGDVQKEAGRCGFSRNALRRAKKVVGATSSAQEPGGTWNLALTGHLPFAEPSLPLEGPIHEQAPAHPPSGPADN